MSSSNLAVRILPETVRTLAAAAVVAGYTAIGTALANPSRILILQNLTDQSVMFSWDGTNDHIALPAGGQLVLDITTNSSTSGAFNASAGTTFYAKRIGTPTTGSVYVSTFYGAFATV